MKYITIPAPIKLGNDGQKDVYQSFAAWLTNPLNGAQFLASGAAMRMSIKLEERFEDKKVGDVVPLADDEWSLLTQAAENPKDGYAHPAAKLFLPYMDLIKKAPETEPVLETEPEGSDIE